MKKRILMALIQNHLGMNDVPFRPQRRRENSWTYVGRCGPGSSVDIVSDYGLGGPGSNPCGDEIFRPSRQALTPTQAPIKWVQGLSRG